MALIRDSTLLTCTPEVSLTELSQMEDPSFRELEKRPTNMRTCSVSDAQDPFLLIELPWSSRWAPSILHTDLSELLWFSPTTMPWRDSSFIWLNHLVHASNIMDALPEEVSKLPEMKSRRPNSVRWQSKRLSLKSQRFSWNAKRIWKRKSKNLSLVSFLRAVVSSTKLSTPTPCPPSPSRPRAISKTKMLKWNDLILLLVNSF